MKERIGVVALLLVFAFPVAAQFTPGVVVSAGFSQPKLASVPTNSFGFAAGGSLRFWRLMGFATLDASAYPGVPNLRYYRDAFSNGQSRCRDTVTGQFALDSLCRRPIETISAGMFDGNVLLSPLPLMVGAGYRLTGAAENRSPYASVGYTRPAGSNLWFIRSLIGPRIIQFQVGIAAQRDRR